MIDHIIFDWDGTLAKTLHLWLAGYRIGLESQQHTFPDSIIARDFFYDHDEGQKKYPDIKFDLLFEVAHSHVHTNLSDLELYPNVSETLSKLKEKGILLSLVSSSPRRLLEAGLNVHNLDSYFISIIAGDDVMKRKPDPESFLQTLNIINTLPEKTLIIGDAKSDIAAGKTAGTQTCIFMPAENALFYDFDTLKHSDADFQITKLSELINKLSI